MDCLWIWSVNGFDKVNIQEPIPKADFLLIALC